MAVISIPTQEKLKLDLYDKKIIFYLSQNSRMPLTELAKKLRISVQRCKYKVDRLQKEILEPAAFMTFPLLDINSYILFTPQLDQEIIDKLIKDESIYFLMQSIGKYQYVINVVTEDISGFCNKYLSTYHIEVHPIINTYADDYNPFKLDITPKPLLPNKRIPLDKKDYKILAHIGEKPTDSLIEIQQALKIDRQTIKQRIKKFEEANIIQKFRYGINIFKLGHIAYILKISVVPKHKKAILQTIRNNNYSGFVFESYSNFTIHFLPPSHNEVFAFTKKLEEIDPTVQIDVIQNTEFYKVDLIPSSVIRILKERANNQFKT